jgi:predicted RNase H-like HicB family nuclease
MNTDLRQQAEVLARRPSTEVIFPDKTTDDDGTIVFVGLTPELPHCIGQGDTPEAALEDLRSARIMYIEHLLEHNLTIPPPAGSP